MFTLKQIQDVHEKVKSGADFPKYIQEIKSIGVKGFETRVSDSTTTYQGEGNFQISSEALYDTLLISKETDSNTFIKELKSHQAGQTDYFQFCKDCAKSGIEKWVVNLEAMTCVYFDTAGSQILVEVIPQ